MAGIKTPFLAANKRAGVSAERLVIPMPTRGCLAAAEIGKCWASRNWLRFVWGVLCLHKPHTMGVLGPGGSELGWSLGMATSSGGLVLLPTNKAQKSLPKVLLGSCGSPLFSAFSSQKAAQGLLTLATLQTQGGGARDVQSLL